MGNYMAKKYLRIIKQVMAIVLSTIMLLCPVFSVSAGEVKEPYDLYSTAAVLMDAETGRVLYSKDGDTPYAMASTTKIMTCILALELGESDRIVEFSEYAASMPDVQMNGKAGEQYYLQDLLYSTMLESHNDSAAAVAESIAGSVKEFVKLMNQKAESIGCTQTHFVTPNGLDGEDEEGAHQTTAKDLAMILRYCTKISYKAEEFIKITGRKVYEFQELNGKRYVSCVNHNAFLDSYEGAFTGKTGFTGKAGYCYTGAVNRDERTLIIALLGAGWYPNKSYKWKDAVKLFDYGFQNFRYQTVGKDDWDLQKIPVIDGEKEFVELTTDATTFSYLLGEQDQLECKMNIKKEIHAPVERDSVIGTIRYEMNGEVIEKFHIYTKEAVKKATLWMKVKKWLRNMWDFVDIL